MQIPYSAWESFAWLLALQCRPRRAPIAGDDDFFIGGIRGDLQMLNGSTVLSLAWPAFYNSTKFSCDDIDFEGMRNSVNFQVLGRTVGRATNFTSTCPLTAADGFER